MDESRTAGPSEESWTSVSRKELALGRKARRTAKASGIGQRPFGDIFDDGWFEKSSLFLQHFEPPRFSSTSLPPAAALRLSSAVEVN